MSVSEAKKEIEDWTENGGQFRVDGPHQGNEQVHAHLYEDKASEDILIQIHPDEED
ncbi:MAG: hypothetical protein J6T72_02430 [Alphaproteobacteria bacterium]|nr:hypothetical protein [Alphaproteobacteria bacterium]